MLSRLGFANEVSAAARPGASEQVENVTALLGASSLLSADNNTHAPAEDGNRPFFDVDNPPGTSPRGTGGGNTPMGGGGPTSFFDNLGANSAATPTIASGRGAAAGNIGQALSIGYSGELETEAEGETDLQRHLFVGNHAAAVSTCLSHDRLADALIVAHVSNDPTLWRSTLSRYMELCPQPYLRVVEVRCIHSVAFVACVKCSSCMHVTGGDSLSHLLFCCVLGCLLHVSSWRSWMCRHRCVTTMNR
jgi:hypothetical protein